MTTAKSQHVFAVQFANEGTCVLVEITNELQIDEDGWAQIAPLGDFPGLALIDDGAGKMKKVKAIQRIDKVAVANMVNSFKESRRGVKKFLNGCPIYVGHPDVPGYESRYPDKSPKGVFANLADRDKGFFGQPVFTNEGSELVDTGRLRALSGRWAAEEIGEENGVKIYRPTVFISAGLTNQPNLPVQLLNESESSDPAPAETKVPRMNSKLLKLIVALCAKAGIQLANDADEAKTETALTELGPKLESVITLANEHPNLKTQLTSKDAEIATLKTSRDTAQTNFANERKARSKDALDVAVSAGRITAAERPTWETRLGVETNFANELEALGKLEAKLKTGSVTIDRGGRKVELANANERREMVAELVTAEMANSKCDYDTAFQKVQRQHPALFEAMQQPETPGAKRK